MFIAKEDIFVKKIPCYFFPSQVVLIDDDRTILDNLVPCLDEDTSVHVTFQNPFKALDYVNAQPKYQPSSDQLIEVTNSEEWQHIRLDFNIYDVHKRVYNPNRFKQISTLVVDYHMPGINGLEFCEKITNSGVQRILLTGDEDEHIAIEAFNQGLIHAYVKKHEFEAIKKLKKAIHDSQFNYFQNLSRLTMSAATFDKSTTALEDSCFVELFFDLIKENKIVEHYLHETTGTFLFLNKKGESSSLFTFTQDQLDLISSFHDYSGPLFDSLKTYEQILCFHSRETVEIPSPSQWHQYVRPAQLLQGDQRYYYAYGANGFDLDHSQILSFEAYLTARSYN